MAEAKVTFQGRLFERTLSRRVVKILNRHIKDTADAWPREVQKRLRRGKGRDSELLSGAITKGRLTKDLLAQGKLTDSRVERYYHRVEYGTPAYGTRGQNQRKNARKALIRKLGPAKVGLAIARELNG